MQSELVNSEFNRNAESLCPARCLRKKVLNDQLKPYTMSALRVDNHRKAIRETIHQTAEIVKCEVKLQRADSVLRTSDTSIQDMSDMFVWSKSEIHKTITNVIDEPTTDLVAETPCYTLTRQTRVKKDGKRTRQHSQKDRKGSKFTERRKAALSELSCKSLAETVVVSNKSPVRVPRDQADD